MKRALRKITRTTVLPAELPDPGPLVNTLKVAYCTITVAIPVYSCYYIGSRLNTSNMYIFVSASLISMIWVGLFQIMVFKCLPQNLFRLLLLFLSSYFLLYIQHFFQPVNLNNNFSWEYYYVSMGISYTLCASVPYALLVMVEGIPKYLRKIQGVSEDKRKEILRGLGLQFIIIIPCLVTSGYFVSYIFQNHLYIANEAESITSLGLWFMGITHNIVSYYFLLKSNSILNDYQISAR